jgi:cell division transport system ATP-binding protein
MAERLMQLFASLNGLGTTVIIATHDMSVIGRIGASHLLRIENGRLSDPTGALRFPPRREPA